MLIRLGLIRQDDTKDVHVLPQTDSKIGPAPWVFFADRRGDKIYLLCDGIVERSFYLRDIFIHAFVALIRMVYKLY